MTGTSNAVMTETQLRLANEIIAWLAANADKDNWTDRIEHLFPGAEFETVMATLDRIMTDMGISRPVAVYSGSTSSLKEAVGAGGPDVTIAFQSLKENYRIVQLGRGRGRAVVLLSNASLDQGSTFKVKASTQAAHELNSMTATTSSEATITW